MNLDSLMEMPIPSATKGLPQDCGTLRLKDVGSQHWNLLEGDVPLPAAVINDRALFHNSSLMRNFLQASGARIAPHGKTTMAPQLFDLQLRDGAWGITVASVQQLMVCRKFGVDRILLANQLIGPRDIDTVITELQADPGFDFYCLVDSVDGCERLAVAARKSGLDRPIQVLLEVGITGGRAGCRDIDGALRVARSIKQSSPYLTLRGVEGFEGIIDAGDPETMARQVSRFLTFLCQVARSCDENDFFEAAPIILTAGGSAFFDIVAGQLNGEGISRPVETVLRSGCYLTHDSGMLQDFFAAACQRSPQITLDGQEFIPALYVWGHVQSVPEEGLAIVNVGKRDISFDIDLPRPELLFRPGTHDHPVSLSEDFHVLRLNDQHAFVRMPGSSPLQIGDMIAFGISHPCTTFDKWRLIYIIDDEYAITDAVATFF